MKSDLKNYVPKNIEFVLEDGVKEIFPLELDFLSLPEEKLCGEKPLKNKADIFKFIGKHFTATFPDNEFGKSQENEEGRRRGLCFRPYGSSQVCS